MGTATPKKHDKETHVVQWSQRSASSVRRCRRSATLSSLVRTLPQGVRGNVLGESSRKSMCLFPPGKTLATTAPHRKMSARSSLAATRRIRRNCALRRKLAGLWPKSFNIWEFTYWFVPHTDAHTLVFETTCHAVGVTRWASCGRQKQVSFRQRKSFVKFGSCLGEELNGHFCRCEAYHNFRP